MGDFYLNKITNKKKYCSFLLYYQKQVEIYKKNLSFDAFYI